MDGCPLYHYALYNLYLQNLVKIQLLHSVLRSFATLGGRAMSKYTESRMLEGEEEEEEGGGGGGEEEDEFKTRAVQSCRMYYLNHQLCTWRS